MTIVAGDLVAEFTFSEAGSGTAPTTVTDETGNGNDLTIDYGTSGAEWITKSADHWALRFGAVGHDAKAELVDIVTNGTLASRLNGKKVMTMLFVIENHAGTTTQERLVFIGSNSGNGAWRITGEASNKLAGRWEGTGGSWPMTTATLSTAFSVFAQLVNSDNAFDDRWQLHQNDVRIIPPTYGANGGGSTLPLVSTADNLTVGNRGDGTRGGKADIFYLAFIDREITAAELTAVTTTLSSNTNDGLFPSSDTPGTPSYSVEAALEDKTDTTITVSMTALSDEGNPVLHSFGLWDPANRPPVGDDVRLTSILAGTDALHHVSRSEVASGVEIQYQFTGLTPSTAYSLYIAVEDSVAPNNAVRGASLELGTEAVIIGTDVLTLTVTTAGGTRLSLPVVDSVGADAAALNATCDIAGELLYGYARVGAQLNLSDIAEILAHDVKITSSVGASNQVVLTGLTPGAAYQFALVLEDAGETSNMVTGNFITESVAGTAPFRNEQYPEDIGLQAGASVNINMGSPYFGGTEPLTFVVSNLPAGLTDTNGVVTGVTPVADQLVTVTCSNAEPTTAEYSVQWRAFGVFLSNPTETPTGDGATLTIESDNANGTLYSYSKATAFGGDEAANAAEIMANGVGQVPVVGTNTRVVTGQDQLTDHYAGWVQDSDGYGGDMVLVFNMGAGETLTIPGGAGTYLYDVDHGDGQTSTGLTTAGFSHTYTDANPETVVRISGVFPHVHFNNGGDIGKLIRILNWGDTSWLSAAGSFYGASNLVEASSEVANTSSVTDMSVMMFNWSSMTSPPDLSSFDTGSVTSMVDMMGNWLSMTSPPNMSSFDTSSATSMSGMMFNWSSMTSPPELSSFDTSSVTNMTSMMRNWSSMTSPPNLSAFDTSSVTNMSSMMIGWSSMGAIDIPIDTWNIGLVTNFTNLLSGSQLTTACYDRTLASWGNQTLAAGASTTTIHFGSSTYTDADSKNLLLGQVAGIIDAGAFDTNTPIWLAATSEFLATGAGSHEMKAQLVGTGTPTFTHSGLTLPDHEGNDVTIEANEAPWYGARKAENRIHSSGNIAGTGWLTQNADATAGGVVTINAQYGYIKHAVTSMASQPAGTHGIIRFSARSISGNKALDVRVFANTRNQITITDEWQVYSVSETSGAIASGVFQVEDRGSGPFAVFELKDVQWENIPGTSPSEYMETTTSDMLVFLDNENGNTVDGNGVVTEAEGTLLAEAPSLYGASDSLIEYDVRNHRDDFGGYYLEVTQQAAGGILSSFLSVVGSNIQLSDGTTTTTSAWVTDTPYKIGVAYGSSMALCVDGVWSADLAYDGTLVSGALDLFRSATGTGIARNIQRYELEFADAKAKVTELMT